MARSIRIESIQILRAIAFIAIFISHAELVSSGMFGVSVFLILSGFCMVYAYFETDRYKDTGFIENSKFAVGRVKKLYPLHLLTMLAVAAIIGLGLFKNGFSLNNTLEFAFYLVMNAMLLQTLIPWRDGYFSFNAVSWYLSVSFVCYFFFPWILNRLRKSDKKTAINFAFIVLFFQIIVSIILHIAQYLLGISRDVIKWITYICPFYRLGDVVIGAFLGYLFVVTGRKERSKKFSYIYTIFVFVLLVLQLWAYEKTPIPRAMVFDMYWLPISMAFVWIFAKWGEVSKNILSQVLFYIGNVSGYAFLIHQIIIKGVGAFVSNKILLVIVAFLLTVICTEIYIWMENKCRDVLKNRL